jgi:hypothetical protein
VHWYQNSTAAEAAAEAAAFGRPLLVDFYHPTCKGCAKLVATTYRDPRVREHLSRHFVLLKYDTTRPNEWFRRLNGSYGHFWHPNVVVLDHHLIEARRFIGFLPAEEYLAQVDVGRALVSLYRTRAREALDLLEATLARWPHAHVAPEALYWAGVASYRVTKRIDALAERWGELARRFPGSQWALRADCLDAGFPPEGFDPRDPGTVTLQRGEARPEEAAV